MLCCWSGICQKSSNLIWDTCAGAFLCFVLLCTGPGAQSGGSDGTWVIPNRFVLCSLLFHELHPHFQCFPLLGSMDEVMCVGHHSPADISVLEFPQVGNVSIQHPASFWHPGMGWWWPGWHFHVCSLESHSFFQRKKGNPLKLWVMLHFTIFFLVYNLLSCLQFSFLSTIFHQKGFNGKFHKLAHSFCCTLHTPEPFPGGCCQTWKICSDILK